MQERVTYKQEWIEDLHRIYLYIGKIIEIPSTISPKFSKLITFIMTRCINKVIILGLSLILLNFDTHKPLKKGLIHANPNYTTANDLFFKYYL